MADMFGQYTTQAYANLGRTLSNIGGTLLSDAIQKKESSEYTEAISKWFDEKNEYTSWQRKNTANPEDYISELDNRREQMLNNILASATTPGARQRITNSFNSDFQQLKESAVRTANNQIDANRVAAFNISYDKITELPTPEDVVDEDWTKSRLTALSELLDENDDILGVESEVYQEQGLRAIFNSYLLFTVQSADEIDNANTIIKDKFNIEGLYNIAEVADLKEEYRFNQEQNLIERRKEEEIVAKQAMDLMVQGDLNGAKDLLKANIENFDTDWFIDELDKIQRASRILADTGKNVYTDTQNWSLYWDDMQKAIDGKLTESQARSHVGNEGYSIGEYEKIVKSINRPASQDFENTKAAKVLKDSVSGMEYYDTNEQLILREKGYRLLEDAIRNSEKPLTERQKVEKALEIFVGLQELEDIEISPESIKTPEELKLGRRKVWTKKGDKKVLTQDGINWLIRKFNSNEQEIRDYANKNGLTIP